MPKKNKGSQKHRIERKLRGTNKTLTVAQAKQMGIMSLRARLTEMRDNGLVVNSVVTKDRTRKYSIAEKDVFGNTTYIY